MTSGKHRAVMPKTRKSLMQAIAEGVARFKAMSPAEQEAHLAEQRKSYVRGEMGFGDEGTRTMKPGRKS